MSDNDSDIQMIPLFSYPLMKTNIKSIREEEINFIKNLDRIRNESDNGYSNPQPNILVECVELANLKKLIEQKFHLYAYDTLKISKKIEFSIVGSFVNFHAPGDSAHLHKHFNSLFSSVLYLNVPKDSGSIVFDHSQFHSPISNEIALGLTEKNVFNTARLKIIPQNYDILFFPSLCFHRVEKNNTDFFRVSLVSSFFPCSTLNENKETILNLSSIKT